MITLVDNGRVSYSNPCRQSLFEFEDCEKRSYKVEYYFYTTLHYSILWGNILFLEHACHLYCLS